MIGTVVRWQAAILLAALAAVAATVPLDSRSELGAGVVGIDPLRAAVSSAALIGLAALWSLVRPAARIRPPVRPDRSRAGARDPAGARPGLGVARAER